VLWLGQDAPASTVFVPIVVKYGAVALPESYHIGMESRWSPQSAWRPFNFVANWIQLRYDAMIVDVRTEQQRLEALGHAALALRSEVSAEQHISIMHAHATNVIESWKRLGETLVVKYSNGDVLTGELANNGEALGYPEWFLKLTDFQRRFWPPNGIDIQPIRVLAATRSDSSANKNDAGDAKYDDDADDADADFDSQAENSADTDDLFLVSHGAAPHDDVVHATLSPHTSSAIKMFAFCILGSVAICVFLAAAHAKKPVSNRAFSSGKRTYHLVVERERANGASEHTALIAGDRENVPYDAECFACHDERQSSRPGLTAGHEDDLLLDN
jgi:hypothetical protein